MEPRPRPAGDPAAASGASWSAGELARLVGVSPDTLRHYERKGVLPPPVRLANGYRRYGAEALERLRTVRAALALGFTLDELAALLRARGRGRPPCREVRELAGTKLELAERRVAELCRLLEVLRAVIAAWDERLAGAAPGAAARLLEALAAAPSLVPSDLFTPAPIHPLAPTRRRKR